MSSDRFESSMPLVLAIADQPDRTGIENVLLAKPDVESYTPEI